jgi:pimeloyl-ACP methyl ester carboxylesterase
MIHVFHGFLGSPSDFGFFASSLVQTHDLYHFNKETFLKALHPEDSLIGYSMGGRLAMELASLSNFKIKKLVLINAHPGLPEGANVPERQIWEESVIERLKSLPQKDFLEYWNRLPLFKGNEPLKPMPEDRFQASLRLFESNRLSRQKNFIPELTEHTDKVLWIAGTEDEKYAQVARDLVQPNGIPCEFIKGGHRLFQHPESLMTLLKAHKIL